MKKSASIFLGFFLSLQSMTLLASSICHTTRVNIKNDSSFDCVLTDFIKTKKTNEVNPVIFKNQSVQFDLSSSGKTLILRYECGHEASILLYFFQHATSSARADYLSDRLTIKPNHLQVESSRKEGECNVFTPGSPAKWFLTIKN